MEVERKPVYSPRITENHAGQPCYLVEYDEDQWNKYDKEGQEHCFAEWAKKAKPMGCVFVVLRLLPDALFPHGRQDAPYVARSYPVGQETFNPVTITCKLTACIDADTWVHASEGDRIKLKTAARNELGMHAMAAPVARTRFARARAKSRAQSRRGAS
jgi:hypothetical protein